MALSFATITAVNSTSSGATLDVTITAAVGTTVYLACAADNAGTAGVSSTNASITDAAGNSWSRVSETNQAGGGANGGTTLSIWKSTITSTLSGSTVTINFSPNTTSKAATGYVVTSGAGEGVIQVSVGAGVTGSGTSFSSGSVSVLSGETIIGFTALESLNVATADADTTDGAWATAITATASTGSANTSQTLSSQLKTLATNSTQSYDTTQGASRDYALNYIVIEPGTSVAITLAVAGEAEIEGGVPSFGTSGNTTLATAGEAEIEGDAPTVFASDNQNFTIATAGAAEIEGAAPTFFSTSNRLIAVRAGRIKLRGYRPTVLPDNDTIAWPSMLPSPRLETHAFQPRLDISRTEMEQGAARQRRAAAGRTMTEVPFSMVCTQIQMAVLEAWVDHIGDYGGQWFVIDLLCAAGYEVHEVRLMGEPEYKELKPDRWMVAGTFEVRDRPMLTEAELDVLIGVAS